MRKISFFIKIVISGFILSGINIVPVNGQFIDDALRLEYGGYGVNARALSMGTAYTAIADDASSLYWNPAGLATVTEYEIYGGLSNTVINNNAFYLGQSRERNTSSTNLNNIGFVIPVPTIQGSFSLGVGFNRANDFSSVLSFNGYNPNNSIIPSLFHSNPEFDLAWQLYLDDEDLITPIRGEINQQGTVFEEGGVHNWTVGGGIEVAPQLFMGFSLSALGGTYRFERSFVEEDVNNHYADFHRLALTNTLKTDISGVFVRFGMLYNVNEIVRIGATIKPPSGYSIEETFSTLGESWFNIPPEGASEYNTYEIEGFTDYKVTTPWTFSGGLSISGFGLTVSGALEFTDWTQLRFRNATPDVMKHNQVIREDLRPTTTIRSGIEYLIPTLDIAVRGGYFIQPSPYRNDPSSYNRSYLTVGLGFVVQETVTFDFAYARGNWKSHQFHYAGSPQVDENITRNVAIATIGYRF